MPAQDALVEEFREALRDFSRQDDARELLASLVEFLGFDRYFDPLALTYGKRIESLLQTVGLPGLADIRFATGEDHDGDPVIRIWVFLTDAEDDAFLSSARELRALIGGTARKVAPDRFPHINFCGMTEQVELENEMAVERMFRALEGVAS